MTSREPNFYSKLTHCQREVLTRLAQQLSESKVARLLDIAEATLKINMAAFRMRFRHWRHPPCPPSPTNRQEDPPKKQERRRGVRGQGNSS